MPDSEKWILVTGSSRSVDPRQESAASRIGELLAESGYGLVIGDWKGVDEVTGTAFLATIDRADRARRCRQVRAKRRLHALRRRWEAEGTSVLDAGSYLREYLEGVEACDAAVVIGGLGGAATVARHARLRRKPVLPLPFSRGDSRSLAIELLENWDDAPIPGLTRTQAMELYAASDMESAAQTVLRLLDIALLAERHTFISYRRNDVPFAAGRVYDELARRFGRRAVFMDFDDLRPGDSFPAEIEAAASGCRTLVAVIGPRWLDIERIADPQDFVRRELLCAKESGARVVPLLVGGVAVTDLASLPDDFEWLLGERNALTIPGNEAWSQGMDKLERQVRASINPGLAERLGSR